MCIDYDDIPLPDDYYRDCIGRLRGSGTWRTGYCNFCDCRGTLRVNFKTGAYACNDCGASGSDVLEHRMADYYESAEQAARALGAWRNSVETHALFVVVPLRSSAGLVASHGV